MVLKKTIVLGAAALAWALAPNPSASAGPINLVKDGTFQDFKNVDTTFSGADRRIASPTTGNGHDVRLTDWTVAPISASGTTNGQNALNFLVTPGWTATGADNGNENHGFNVWTTLAGGASNGFYDTASAAHPLAPTGNYIVADGAETYRGAISQTLSDLTAGQQYAVSFLWAAGQQKGTTGATTGKGWSVSFGNATQTSDPLVSNVSQGFSGWFEEKMVFTASGSSQLLSFLANGSPNSQPPLVFLANVSVTAVPEPSAVVSLALGAAGLAGLALRRRRAR